MSKRRVELGLAEAALLSAALGEEARAAAAIIDGKREGREHIWALNPARLAEPRRCLEVITRSWDDALGRLKAHLEGE